MEFRTWTICLVLISTTVGCQNSDKLGTAENQAPEAYVPNDAENAARRQLTDGHATFTCDEQFAVTGVNFLPGSTVHASDLRLLQSFPRLSNVSFARCRTDDKVDLATWLKLPNLRSLDLSATVPSSDLFKVLADLDHLRELRLFDVTLTSEQAEDLGKLNQLTALHVISCTLHRRISSRDQYGGWDDEAMKAISRLENLEALTVSCGDLSTDGLKLLKSYPRLRDLRVIDESHGGSVAKPTDAALAIFSGIKTLEKLAYARGGHAANYTVSGIGNLRKLPALRELTLSTWSIADEELAEIGAIETLERLDLFQDGIKPDGLVHLAGLRNLRELNLSTNPVGVSSIPDNLRSSQGLYALKPLVNLTRLQLNGCKIADADYPAFGQLKKLQSLELEHNGLSDQGIAVLASIDSLEELSLPSGAAMPLSAIKPLSRLPNLRVVSFQACFLKRVDGSFFEGWPRLESIDLSGAAQHMEADALAGFHQLTSLRHMSLRNRKIGKEQFSELQRLPRLEELDLAGTSVNDGHIADIVAFENLKKVDLRGSKMSLGGIGQIHERRPAIIVSWGDLPR